MPTGLRALEPLKMTSAIDSPRSVFAELSPMTQRTASMTFDLPQPLGPTTPVRLLGRWMTVGSTKDLNPASLILLRRMRRCSTRMLVMAVDRMHSLRYKGTEPVLDHHLLRPGAHYHDGYSNPRLPASGADRAARDISEPGIGAGLYHPHAHSRVHLPLPAHGPARLRDPAPRVHSRPPVCGAQVAQALRVVVSRYGRVPRGCHEPHLERPGPRAGAS